MKKILTIIAIACIAFATPSQAQVKFGLKGGLNLTIFCQIKQGSI